MHSADAADEAPEVAPAETGAPEVVPSQARLHKGRKPVPEQQQPAKSKKLPRYVREALEEVAAERKSKQTPQSAVEVAQLPSGSSAKQLPAALSAGAGKAEAPAAVKHRKKVKSKVTQ